jgi:hypothetical protein
MGASSSSQGWQGYCNFSSRSASAGPRAPELTAVVVADKFPTTFVAARDLE